MVKRALDQGAHGVMTPMCHTVVCDPLLSLSPTLSRIVPAEDQELKKFEFAPLTFP